MEIAFDGGNGIRPHSLPEYEQVHADSAGRFDPHYQRLLRRPGRYLYSHWWRKARGGLFSALRTIIIACTTLGALALPAQVDYSDCSFSRVYV